MTSRPRLSIGLPVFNGQEYVAQVIESLLAQTFRDFELIVSDNASTDATQEIIAKYARQDPRIRYHRNEVNIGATQNWYRVHQLASGYYFASAAHDDLYSPDYMRACIEVLERDQSVAVCHTKTRVIDQSGNATGVLDVAIDTTSPYPSKRLYQILRHDYLCVQLYGVMRSSVLGRTRVFQGYYSCDRNTLAELCLLGRIVEIPEYLFHHRLYGGALGWIVKSGKSLEEMTAIDPGTDWSHRSVSWTVWRNYFQSVSRLVDSPGERARCYVALGAILARRVPSRVRRVLKSLRP